MTDAAPSMRLRSLYITRFLLEATGALLVVCAIFTTFLAYEFKGRNGGHVLSSMILEATLMLVDGIGFLVPQLWTKFLSSFLLVGAAVWLFIVDAYRWSNWKFDCLLFVPLLLTLWLSAGYRNPHLQRIPNAN
jgi:hypothetical protein